MSIAALPAHAAETTHQTIRGKNGVVAEFSIVSITAEGFQGLKKEGGAPLFIRWDQVDLDWLRDNSPTLYRQMVEAANNGNPFGDAPGTPTTPAQAPAPAAPPPQATEAPPAKPPTAAEVARALLNAWNMNRVQIREDRTPVNPQSPLSTIGAQNRLYWRNRNFYYYPYYTAHHLTSSGAVLEFIGNQSDEGRSAYEHFRRDSTLQSALIQDAQAAIAVLKSIRTQQNAKEVEPLMNSAERLIRAIRDIAGSTSAIRRDSLADIERFTTAWQRGGAAP